MKPNSFTDFILCTTAIVLAVAVAVFSTIDMIKLQTAIVFLSISVALIGMSLLDIESPLKTQTKKSKKSTKRRK